jgi:adhesin/invasin
MQRLTTFLLAGAVVAGAACSSSSEPTNGNGNGNGGDLVPTSIVAVSGDNQRIVVGGMLMEPLVVEVRDQNGDGISGVTVEWAVTAGGGSLSASSSTSGSDGRTSVTLTAGSSEGTNTVTATVSGLTGSPISFDAAAVAPATITIDAGNNQSARTSQPLANPLVVEVTAGDAGPVPGATVDWMVTGGGGSLSSASSTTDASGLASNQLTLGSGVGANTVEAAAAPSVTANFTADATQPVMVTVDMSGIAFVAPGGGDDITIQLGDTVQWVNQDGVQHTATSQSVPTGGSSFDSGLLSQGGSFTFVPDARGEWVYFCEVHPAQMADARITVQ